MHVCLFIVGVSETGGKVPSGEESTFLSMTRSMLQGCISVLAAIEITYCIGGLPVDFSRHEVSMQLNVLFRNTGMRWILQEKITGHWTWCFHLWVAA